MSHRYLNDDALIALGMQTPPRPERYRVHESIKPNTYRRMPRDTVVAFTDCLVTRSDGTQYVIERETRYSKRSKSKSTASTVNVKVAKREALIQSLPSIHEGA